MSTHGKGLKLDDKEKDLLIQRALDHCAADEPTSVEDAEAFVCDLQLTSEELSRINSARKRALARLLESNSKGSESRERAGPVKNVFAAEIQRQTSVSSGTTRKANLQRIPKQRQEPSKT